MSNVMTVRCDGCEISHENGKEPQGWIRITGDIQEVKNRHQDVNVWDTGVRHFCSSDCFQALLDKGPRK